jgi:hypothetical protein
MIIARGAATNGSGTPGRKTLRNFLLPRLIFELQPHLSREAILGFVADLSCEPLLVSRQSMIEHELR